MAYRSFADPVGHVEEVAESPGRRHVNDQSALSGYHHTRRVHCTNVVVPVWERDNTGFTNVVVPEGETTRDSQM